MPVRRNSKGQFAGGGARPHAPARPRRKLTKAKPIMGSERVNILPGHRYQSQMSGRIKRNSAIRKIQFSNDKGQLVPKAQASSAYVTTKVGSRFVIKKPAARKPRRTDPLKYEAARVIRESKRLS